MTKLTKQQIQAAMEVLDAAYIEQIEESKKRDDMLKENFRRDALSLQRAADILEALLPNAQ